ncbi:hypothetical protein [Streptomyces sp. NBC_00557]|uniref:hypothetical protein n=1 Tax=Streptomyces sp. NBC_00557 TaxID=2975776 RepID=UPI002E7FCF3F|nr:hypothetical protein [Streptomyces sp. NBC_00557]WUC35958.1 hypothetical protein OG956_17895 [Streptomyces sp. NBC_00557]
MRATGARPSTVWPSPWWPALPGGRDPRKLRLIALAAAVTAAVVLPLAVASAGPVGKAARQAVDGRAGNGGAGNGGAGNGRAGNGRAGNGRAGGGKAGGGKTGDAVRASGRSGVSGSDGGPGSEGDGGSGSAVGSRGAGDAQAPSHGRGPGLLGTGLDIAARCGPQLTSPDGIEAQTCVLTQGTDTWARTYYRNSTGESLDSSLSLMGPGDGSVQTRCVTGADDEPATCETPRERSRGGMDAYTAVTEFSAHGKDGALLLRSGSNTADGDGNSGTA